MDLPHASSFTPATRHDGWSPALKARFLSILAEKGNVRAAAARCGMSAQSAYVQRRRDPDFAQGWAGAVVLAREHCEQVLADRALEGVEEQVYYRGELVGTRRRYDNRLLLVHLARLDRLAEDEEARHAAGRFDELLAIVAGEPVPAGLALANEGPWPQDRNSAVINAAVEAERAAVTAHLESPDRYSDGAEEACDAAMAASSAEARATAAAQWDDWFDRACDAVDRLEEIPLRQGEEFSLRTASSVSTSGLRPAVADGGDQGDAALGIGEWRCAGPAADRGDGVFQAGEPAFSDPVEGE